MFSNRSGLRFAIALCVAVVAFAEGAAVGGLVGTDASADVNSTLYGVDTVSGGYSTIGTTGQLLMSGLAYDANTQTLYGATNGNRLYVIDELTGMATPAGTELIGFDVASNGLAFDTNANILYLTDAETDSLYTLDVGTGAAVKKGATSVPDIVGLAYDPGNSTLYGVSGSASSLYTLATDGTATLVGSLGFTPTLNSIGLAYDPGNDKLYMSNDGNLYSLNTTNGAATSIGATGVSNIPGLAFASVPEPTGLHLSGLLCCWIAGYAWCQRCRRRRVAKRGQAPFLWR